MVSYVSYYVVVLPNIHIIIQRDPTYLNDSIINYIRSNKKTAGSMEIENNVWDNAELAVTLGDNLSSFMKINGVRHAETIVCIVFKTFGNEDVYNVVIMTESDLYRRFEEHSVILIKYSSTYYNRENINRLTSKRVLKVEGVNKNERKISMSKLDFDEYYTRWILSRLNNTKCKQPREDTSSNIINCRECEYNYGGDCKLFAVYDSDKLETKLLDYRVMFFDLSFWYELASYDKDYIQQVKDSFEVVVSLLNDKSDYIKMLDSLKHQQRLGLCVVVLQLMKYIGVSTKKTEY